MILRRNRVKKFMFFVFIAAFAFVFSAPKVNAQSFAFDVSGSATQGSVLVLSGIGTGHQMMFQNQSATVGFVNHSNYSPIGEINSTQESASQESASSQRSWDRNSGVRTVNISGTSFEVAIGDGVYVGNSSGSQTAVHTYGNATGNAVSGAGQTIWFDLP